MMIIKDTHIKGTCNQIIEYLTTELSQLVIDKTILLEDRIELINNFSEVLNILCNNYLGHQIVKCIRTPQNKIIIQ